MLNSQSVYVLTPLLLFLCDVMARTLTAILGYEVILPEHGNYRWWSSLVLTTYHHASIGLALQACT